MAGEWPRTPLGELVQNFDFRRVPLSSREREKRRGNYPYYGATGIMDYVDDFLLEGLYLLIAEDGSIERPDGKPVLQLVNGRFWVNNHAQLQPSNPRQGAETPGTSAARRAPRCGVATLESPRGD